VGGASRAGIDCSGLVMVVFAQFGAQLPHNAQLQYNAVPHIRDDQLQPATWSSSPRPTSIRPSGSRT